MDQFPHLVTEEQMLRRICSEYLEMPGLRLKREQAQRLWGLDEATCTQLLQVLVESGFLCRNVGDMYVRMTDGPFRPKFPMARRDLVTRRASNTGKAPSAA